MRHRQDRLQETAGKRGAEEDMSIKRDHVRHEQVDLGVAMSGQSGWYKAFRRNRFTTGRGESLRAFLTHDMTIASVMVVLLGMS